MLCECFHPHLGNSECPWPQCPCSAFIPVDLDAVSKAALSDMEQRGIVETFLFDGKDVWWGDGLVWVVTWQGKGIFDRDRRKAIIQCWSGSELAT